jgi:ATP-dependent RNA helicase DDX59
LIILPTRDIAIQVEEMTKELCMGIKQMKTGLVIGGMSSAQQSYRLDSNIQIIISTPGRLLELSPDLSHCFTVVIDECDVLLDASFHEQVKSVMRLLPSRHQTLMFSATISEDTRRYAKQLLYHPVHINVGKPSNPTKMVKQMILWVENDCKKKKLLSILQDKRFNKPPLLVFVENKLGALLLADFLINKDVLCGVIHGDKSQEERNKIIAELETGRYPVLVSTNILGRGINMPSVTQVILFDLPSNLDLYVHQIGRALSSNTIGTALVFINNSNKSMFLQLFELSISPMVTLPIQLVNSPHLAYQKQSKAINENRDKVRLKG